jgi:hypothetical protein
MPPILLGEYRNKHSRRKYPFADDATLADNDGQTLPTDFLVDAFLYPIDLIGQPYLSQVDLNDKLLTFSDSETGAALGYAEFENTSASAQVYENGPHQRQIGVLVFGDGLASLFRGRDVRTFSEASTALCPTVYIPLNQSGVRGIELDDGTLITGPVVFEGQDGIVAKTYTDMSGNAILEFNMVGVLPPTIGDCGDDCGVIKEICFQRAPGSRFMISEYGPQTIALTSYGFSLEDICNAQSAIRLPDDDGYLPLLPKPGDDPCGVPPIPPLPPDPGPEVEICFEMADGDGNVFIVTPSAAGYTNAIGIKELDHVGVTDSPSLRLPATVRNAAEALKYTADFIKPPSFADGLAIIIKGLSGYRS